MRSPPTAFLRRILCIRLHAGSVKDLAALARLAEHCERYSPIVGWETVEGGEGPKSKVQGPKSDANFGPWTSDFGLWLDITGIGILFGGEEALAHALIADLAGLGYEVRVGIADTIGAAWAAAELLSPPLPPFRIPHSAFRIESLRLPPETLALLSQLGLERLDQLLVLPRSSLRARFGERLLLRIDQFTGAAQETIVAYRPPPKFAAEKVLEYPAEQRELIEQVVQDLINQIATALAERREGVVQLACRLDCAPGQPVTIEVGLFRPSANPQHLWELVRMQLEQLRLPGAVGRFTLQARLTAPLDNRQGQLFAGNQDEASRQFGLLIDRLTSRLGPDAVLRPQLVADPRPDRAVAWEAAVSRRVHERSEMHRRRGRSKVQSPKSKVAAHPWTLDLGPWTSPILKRPLTLEPLHALAVTSVFPDGPPLAFQFQGRQHRVAHFCGPERIETGWWRGANVRRDYYRVQTEDGLRFWLFRDLKTGQWHLHGDFS